MLDILSDRTYRHLFGAQVVALLGTGLATVALGLLAYDLAGDEASMVLGTVFTIKMVAYVGIAPPSPAPSPPACRAARSSWGWTSCAPAPRSACPSSPRSGRSTR